MLGPDPGQMHTDPKHCKKDLEKSECAGAVFPPRRTAGGSEHHAHHQEGGARDIRPCREDRVRIPGTSLVESVANRKQLTKVNSSVRGTTLTYSKDSRPSRVDRVQFPGTVIGRVCNQ
jgi:hypothetical protein